MPVSAERRAALRRAFDGGEPGIKHVAVSDIVGVLDDLDAAERRERINARAFEALLKLGNCDKQQQEMAVVAWRRLEEFKALAPSSDSSTTAEVG